MCLSTLSEWHYFKSYFDLDAKLIIQMNQQSPALPTTLIKLKKSFKFPSFRRIDKSIQDLINMKIVLAREGNLENEKIKGLYFLNPIGRSQLNKLKK